MIHHQLAYEGQSFVDTSAGIAYSADPTPRVNLKLVAATILLFDLAGYILLCLALGRGPTLPAGGSSAAMIAWFATPAAIWLASGYATALYTDAAIAAPGDHLLPALATACLAFAPWAIAAELPGPGGIGISWVLQLSLCQLAFVVAVRGGWSAVLRTVLRHGYCLQKAIILSKSVSASNVLCAALERQTNGRLRVAASASGPRLREEGSLVWLESTIRSHGIDRIVLANDGAAIPLDHETIFGLMRVGSEITVLSADGTSWCLHAKSSDLPRLDGQASPLNRWQHFYKRMFDIVVATIGLLCLAPLLLALMVVVRLDSPGPSLFRQTRQGRDGKLFEILKFRTMYVNLADPNCSVQTSRGDARVTRIGRFLRTSSIDELPQMLNVLLGDMSIIGPRPHADGMTVDGKPLARVFRGYEARLRMKPGITGWAQVNGARGEVDGVATLRRRVALDCYYIENWSLLLDLWILCRTVALVFRDKHAF